MHSFFSWEFMPRTLSKNPQILAKTRRKREEKGRKKKGTQTVLYSSQSARIENELRPFLIPRFSEFGRYAICRRQFSVGGIFSDILPAFGFGLVYPL